MDTQYFIIAYYPNTEEWKIISKMYNTLPEALYQYLFDKKKYYKCKLCKMEDV
jgi:hypothetical protein